MGSRKWAVGSRRSAAGSLRQRVFPSPEGRGWLATALSPAVAGRVRGQLPVEERGHGNSD
ncbi:MAG TPA: hypothetical protein VEO19_09445 [Terriglobia bacterium]|nr:hypothetical protein [Terriglobia bacterium]